MTRFDCGLQQFWGEFVLDQLDLVFVRQNNGHAWDLVYFKVVDEVLRDIAVRPKHLYGTVHQRHLLHHLFEQLGWLVPRRGNQNYDDFIRGFFAHLFERSCGVELLKDLLFGGVFRNHFYKLYNEHN